MMNVFYGLLNDAAKDTGKAVVVSHERWMFEAGSSFPPFFPDPKKQFNPYVKNWHDLSFMVRYTSNTYLIMPVLFDSDNKHICYAFLYVLCYIYFYYYFNVFSLI